MELPEQLRALNQWHCWQDVNGQKLPVQVNGQAAKSNDRLTWTDFESALEASKRFSGLAFTLGDGPFTGVDLDNCLDAFGNLLPWAVPVVSRLEGIAYAEISPSGRGIKFLTVARKPEGARCVHRIGGPKEQIECYDHSRFWTVTGNIYNFQTVIGDGQAAIDWLAAEYLTASNPTPTQAPVDRPATSWIAGSELERRAQAYADSVPLPAVGGRNQACFSLGGHLATIEDDFGNRLSEDQVVSIVRQWALSQGATPREGEIEKAVASSFRNGTARPVKASQPMPEIKPDPDVDLSGIMNQLKGPDGAELPADFPRIEIPGLIGDLVDFNLRTAHYPLPELALAGAIALMSSVTGGKVEGLRARSNLFVMGLAPSGGGKDHARKLNRKVLQMAGHSNICGPERIGSHAGVVSAMAENWNTLFQIDEIGRLLATMQSAQTSPHLYNIASVLLQIYSSADDMWQADAYGDRKKVKRLEYPHCVVYGTSVPDGFWESLSKKNLTEGLIGRFLVFENAEYVDYQEPEEFEIPESIIIRAKDWLDHKTHAGNLSGLSSHEAAHPQRIHADEEATRRLRKHAIDISERRKGEEATQAAIWSRHAEKTNKLALLFACSRWTPDGPWPTIGIEDANKAILLNNWLTRRMLRRAGLHVVENHYERDRMRILRLIQTKPEWTLTELCRATRWMKSRDRNEIINAMSESGEVVTEQRPTDGRPIMLVRPA